MQGSDPQHEKYMAEEAADIKAISGIEITIQRELLQDMLPKAAYKYAIAIYIQKKNILQTKEKRKFIAHRAMISTKGTITRCKAAALLFSSPVLIDCCTI